jgi:hypothetical protein
MNKIIQSQETDIKCPECGAEQHKHYMSSHVCLWYACGTMETVDGGFRISKQCFRNQLLAKESKLQSITGRLPKTADGVIWLPWEDLPVYELIDGKMYTFKFDKIYHMPGFKIKYGWGVKSTEDGYCFMLEQCYSTPEEAQKDRLPHKALLKEQR